MKLADERQDVQYSTKKLQKRSQEFRIAATAKSFEILSSGLYSDKYAAIIRELSTNAYDSHIEASNEDTPFDIHLPTRLEPWFFIRDYGIGLTKDEVYDIYTTYFASDKTHTNRMVGCLGLGSKVAFSYTKSFSVTSFKNGIKYEYTAYIGESGVPTITLMDKSQTTEPNGVRIQFAVHSEDVIHFHRRAKAVLQYLPTVPNIIGKTIEVSHPQYVIEESTPFRWGVRQDDDICISGKAIMGNVAYPINISELQDQLRYNEIRLLRLNLDIYFQIGELDIEASREGLRYTETTKENLASKMKQVATQIHDRIGKEIQKEDCLWNARIKLIKLLQQLNTMDSLSRYNWYYNGQKIKTQVEWNKWNASNTLNLLVSHIDYTPGGHSRKQKRTSLGGLDFKRLNFIENDLPRGGESRARKYVRDNEKEILFCEFYDKQDRQKWIDLLGIPESWLIKASTLPKNQRKPRAPRAKTKTKVCLFQLDAFNEHESWKDIEKDLNDGGWYVELNRYKVKSDNTWIRPQSLSQIIRNLQNAGITINCHIYGVKTAYLKKLPDGKWTNFLEWAKEQVKQFNHQEVKEKLGNGKEFEDIRHDYRYINNIFNINTLELICPNSNSFVNTVLERMKKCKEAAQERTKYRAMRILILSLTDTEKLCVEPTIHLKEEQEQLFKQFPLLRRVKSTDLKKGLDSHIREYIKLVEKGELKC